MSVRLFSLELHRYHNSFELKGGAFITLKGDTLPLTDRAVLARHAHLLRTSTKSGSCSCRLH